MKKEISWLIALVITVYVSVLQLIMYSTAPLDFEVNTGRQILNLKLIRLHTGDSDCPIILPVEDISISGYLLYRSDAGNKTRLDFKREGDKLVCMLPKQSPPSGLEYQIYLQRGKNTIPVNDSKPIKITNKGHVPVSLTLLYGLLIFSVILLSSVTGLFAAFGVKAYKWMIFLTVLSFAGLAIFVHPLIQKLAFNKLFAVPDTWDLNSKILLSFLIWSLALVITLWRSQKFAPIVASAISVIIFLIPHQFQREESVRITMVEIQKNFIALLQLF